MELEVPFPYDSAGARLRGAESRVRVTVLGQGSCWLVGAAGVLGKTESPGQGC